VRHGLHDTTSGRRCVCRSCGRTHALPPRFLLAYRRDTGAVTGDALVAAATGGGHRTIAEQADLPAATVQPVLSVLQNGVAVAALHDTPARVRKRRR